LWVLLGCSKPITPPPEAVVDPMDAVVDSIGEVGQFQQISVDNSRVAIEAIGVDRAVKAGRRVVPALLRKMRQDEVDFDTFVRCYSATLRIAEAEYWNTTPYWYGGAGTPDPFQGEQRLSPGWEAFDKPFRDRVITSIEEGFRKSDPSGRGANDGSPSTERFECSRELLLKNAICYHPTPEDTHAPVARSADRLHARVPSRGSIAGTSADV
jgi:hypothetical protein